MQTAHLITDENVMVAFGGRQAIVSRSFAEGAGVIAAIVAGDYARALRLCDRSTAIVEASAGAFSVQSGVVYRNVGGNLVAVHNIVTRRIIETQEAGLPYTGLLTFLDNLEANPSKRAVDELYSFLEHKFLPVTPDGHFIAYKGVRSNYFSVMSGSLTLLSGRGDGPNNTGHIYNGVGELIECPRNEVDDNKDATCSVGLHVGTANYAIGWGARTVVVKVNPRDAVSVPSDHNAEKLRVHRYEVVADFVSTYKQPLATVGASAPAVSAATEEVESSECEECGVEVYDGSTLCDICS
jgi:hypothetical protein